MPLAPTVKKFRLLMDSIQKNRNSINDQKVNLKKITSDFKQDLKRAAQALHEVGGSEDWDPTDIQNMDDLKEIKSKVYDFIDKDLSELGANSRWFGKMDRAIDKIEESDYELKECINNINALSREIRVLFKNLIQVLKDSNPEDQYGTKELKKIKHWMKEEKARPSISITIGDLTEKDFQNGIRLAVELLKAAIARERRKDIIRSEQLGGS